MEGISIYIFIFILIISTVIQFARKANAEDSAPDQSPNPGNPDIPTYPESFDDQVRAYQEAHRAENTKRSKLQKSKYDLSPEEEGVRAVRNSSANIITEPEETPDYTIHSGEEAKRAIIWSEILQRKY